MAKKFLSIAVQDVRVETSTTTANSSTAADLIDSGADFVTDAVAVGDIVHNTTDDAYHVVATIVDGTHLTFDSGTVATDKAYTVYSGTASTNQLVSMDHMIMAEQTDVRNVDITMSSGDAANVVNISHQDITALTLTMRTAIEDAVLAGQAKAWLKPSETVVLPTGIKVTNIAIS